MNARTFGEFWPHYLRAHSRPRTRVLHAVGSILALTCLGLAAAVDWRWLPAAPAVGYAFAWYGHFFVEHNRPATFGHPFYSLAADYVMLWKMLTGTLEADLRAATAAGPVPPQRTI